MPTLNCTSSTGAGAASLKAFLAYLPNSLSTTFSAITLHAHVVGGEFDKKKTNFGVRARCGNPNLERSAGENARRFLRSLNSHIKLRSYTGFAVYTYNLVTTFASAPFALFIGPNFASACGRLAFSSHPKGELLELALTIVAPTTHSTLLDSYRGDVLINLQECVPPKRNPLGVSRGHAGQEEENEARGGGSQHDTITDSDERRMRVTAEVNGGE